MRKSNFKRWFPFITMFLVGLGASIKLFIFTGNPEYRPLTNDPKIIYKEACLSCHGPKGEGNGLLVPPFDKTMLKEDIKIIIKNGNWLMPAYKNVNADTLMHLTDFIYRKDYLK